MKEQVKRLWQLCFDDDPAFVDLYFRLRYTADVNLAIRSGDEVIAALQLLPYPMTFAGTVVPTAYISGACTHPDYRGRGVMRELLSQALARMSRDGALFSTLIPAQPWLFRYYARSGYAPAFPHARTRFTDPGDMLPPDAPVLMTTTDYRPADFAFLDRHLRRRPCCVLHPEADYRILLADLQLEHGFVGTLHRGGEVAALALVCPDADGTWRVLQALAATGDLLHLLLVRLCRHLRTPTLTLLRTASEADAHTPLAPHGMARVVNVPAVLRLYAEAHPEADTHILLTDDQLSTNTGYYRLAAGQCRCSRRPFAVTPRAMTPASLADWLFRDTPADMSLMMD